MFVCFHLSNHKFNVLDWSGWMPLRMVYNSIQRPEIDIAQPPTTTVLLNSPSFRPKLVGGLSTESNNTRMELHIHMMTFLHSVLMWSDNTSSDSDFSQQYSNLKKLCLTQQYSNLKKLCLNYCIGRSYYKYRVVFATQERGERKEERGERREGEREEIGERREERG